MYENIGIVLLALHLLGDFPLQTDWMAANKLGGGVAHAVHIGVHLVAYSAVLFLLYGSGALPIAVGVAICHGIIDLSRWAEPKEAFEDYPIWVDQALHVASIALAVTVL